MVLAGTIQKKTTKGIFARKVAISTDVFALLTMFLNSNGRLVNHGYSIRYFQGIFCIVKALAFQASLGRPVLCKSIDDLFSKSRRLFTAFDTKVALAFPSPHRLLVEALYFVKSLVCAFSGILFYVARTFIKTALLIWSLYCLHT